MAGSASRELANDLRKVLDAIDGLSSVETLQHKLNFRDAAWFDRALAALVAKDLIREAESSTGALDFTSAPASPQSNENATREAAERARHEAEAKARKAAEEKAAHEAAERARHEAEAKARKAAEEKAAHEAADRARHEAEAKARKVAEEKAAHEAAERARHEAEAKARKAAEEKAAQEAAERARREAEAQARKLAEEQELKLAAERVKSKAAEQARKDAEEQARKAEEEALREAAERARLEAEAQARQLAEEQTLREAAERARREAEEKAQRMAEELARRDAEEKARREAEEKTRRDAEEKVRRETEEKVRRETEEKVRRETEEKARRDAEEKARREGEERARREAEEDARREAERARQDAEAKARRDAEEEARREAEEQASREGEGARQDAEAQKRQAAEEKAWRETEEKSRREQEEAAAKREKKAAAKEAKAGLAKPIKWGKPLAAGIVLLLVIGLAVIHLISYDGQIPQFEKAAAARFQQPVKIKAIRLALVPQTHMRLEGVSIGAEGQIKVPQIKVTGDLGNLFGAKKVFKSIELDSPVVTEAGLGWILFGKLQAGDLEFGQLSASNVRLESKNLSLPAFEAKLQVEGDGAWKTIAIESTDKNINVELTPKGDSVQIDFKARSFKIPFGSNLTLEDLVASGTANRAGLAVTEFKGFAFGGILSGNARLKWGEQWNLAGELNAKQVDASRLLPGAVDDARLAGAAVYVMQGSDATKLFAANRMEGNFTSARGTLHGVDLGRMLQGGAMSGDTRFAEASGVFVHDRGATQLRQVRLGEGAMSANGTVDVDADSNVRGRFSVELKMAMEHRRANLVVAGTLQKIEWRRP